jgi:hypothetical protein
MFAAAAIVASKVYDAAVMAAQWLAMRAFVIAIIAIMLPWVLRGVLGWGFNWMVTYGKEITSLIMDYINTATSGNVAVDIDLTGLGGYLAYHTGLLDYASIIFTGWGLYWVIAILAKTPRTI